MSAVTHDHGETEVRLCYDYSVVRVSPARCMVARSCTSVAGLPVWELVPELGKFHTHWEAAHAARARMALDEEGGEA